VVVRPPTSHAAVSSSAGKTTLAVEAAWQLYEAGRFDFIFWLAGSSRVELESGLAALARVDALSLMQEEVADHHVRLHAVRQWLRAPEREGRFLVLIDGVDQEAQWMAAQSILPWLDHGTVLITSRLTLAWKDTTSIELGALPVEASSKLLVPAGGREPTHSQRAATERLASLLGWQPVALRLASLTLQTLGQTPERFVAELDAEVLDSPQKSNTQGVRWLTTFEKVIRRAVKALDPADVPFLQTLVAFAPQPAGIPIGIVSGRPDAEKLRASTTHLDRCGLITLADGGQTIFVHRLVREIVRDRMTPTENAAALDSARALIEGAFPRSGRAGASATQRERLVPHCRVVLGQLNGHPLEVHASALASGLASWLRDCGRLSEAEHFQRRALHIVEKSCAPNHPDLVPELRLLAHILRDQRRYTDAVALHRRAISILEKNPGASRELVSELFFLANCLRGAQRLDEAEPVLRRALALEEKTSGPDHPRTAIAAHTLAGLLEAAHRPVEALPLYRRALEIDEGAPLSTPARIALRLQHLAGALASSDRREEAIEMQRRAIALEESAFGRSSAELIGPLKQLAGLLEQENRPAEAEDLYRRALALEEISPAVPPLEIASTLTGLASVLAAQEDFTNANLLATRALSLLPQGQNAHPLARALAEECRSLLRG
jgi:tetratricopeptide (TPR) repeat protein